MTKLRVLIVDDEAMFTQSLRRLLMRQHDVAVANDGLEALTAVRAGQRFDVILSDVNMPQMTGIELFEQLLELAPDQAQHFVFLTGGAGPTQQRLRALGTRQLEKPVDITALRAMIVEVGGGGDKGSEDEPGGGGNGGGNGTGGNGSGSGGNGRMSEGPGSPNERLSAIAGY